MNSKTTRLIACLCGTSLGMNAMADWPSDPGAPLNIGEVEAFTSDRLAAVSGPDGTVWVSWQDAICLGDMRIQRIGTDGSLLEGPGMVVAGDPSCAFFLPPILRAIGDSALVARQGAALDIEPMRRIGVNGAEQWPGGFTTTEAYYAGAVAELEGGDALLVSLQWDTMRVDRIDATGASVWDQPTMIPSGIGANFRILGALPDAEGGAIIVWDSPSFPYTRLIQTQRVLADGQVAWEEGVRMMGMRPMPTSSRFTDPAIVADGQGGAIVLFVEGFEQSHVAMDLLMQHVDSEGNLSFPLEGHQVSLGENRHFDPIILADPSGDFVVVWRDGFEGTPSIRAQRITVTGDRLWGDLGVEVEPAFDLTSNFDAVLESGRLVVASEHPTGVTVRTLDPSGSEGAPPVTVMNQESRSVRIVASGNGVIVTATQDLEGLDDRVVAQRVNRGGRLGDPGCNAADLAMPIGSLDFSDVVSFLGAFGDANTMGDLAPPIGVFDFSDVVAFLGAFGAGCP